MARTNSATAVHFATEQSARKRMQEIYTNGVTCNWATVYKDDHLYSYSNVADNQWLAMLCSKETAFPNRLTSAWERRHTELPGTAGLSSPNVDLNTGTLNIRARLDNQRES